MDTDELAGKRITVMGLGLLGGGLGVARFLVHQGARVTATDLKDEAALADSVAKLDGLGVTLHLGGHRAADFSDADMVVVNPAVPASSPFLAVARQAGVRLDTEINLFFKRCPATIAGVTGSNGKSTTVSLLHHILTAGPRRAWLGGNIGRSLLEDLPDIRPDDLVVLELSSFQLERLAPTRLSPAISAVLNLSPNHLDRHGTVENYARAKQAILANQRHGHVALLNADCHVVRTWRALGAGRKLLFSTAGPLERGAWLDGQRALWHDGAAVEELFTRADLKLPGDHYLADALAAAGAAVLCGIDPAAIRPQVATFRGLEHRLEFVRSIGGVRYYNDSKATTPEAAVAALDAFDVPVVLIAGGYDKHLPFDKLARAVCRKARAAVLLAQTAEQIQRAIAQAGDVPAQIVPDLPAAVRAARAAARPGDVVALSPACASYGMFDNFEERGALFKKIVQELTP